jgi:heme-degrading monooxygenase HmoA
MVALYHALPERWNGVLYRALRDDAAFRFVAVADAGDDVVREIGTPDVAGGVVLVEPFEVPDGADERFLDAWERLRAARAQQRGYLGSRLHRRAGAAEHRFVDVTRWSSPLMFARATALPEVEAASAAMPFASCPALYIAAR